MNTIRRRHTFLIDFNDVESVNKYKFSGNKVETSDFESVREDVITIPFELVEDKDVHSVLDSVDKLQIRWSRYGSFDRNLPFNSVQEPGLHIDLSGVSDWAPITSFIKAHFDDSFQGIESTVQAPNWNSFFLDTSINSITNLIQHLVCSIDLPDCSAQFTELRFADSFQLTYGVLASNPRPSNLKTDVVINALWTRRRLMSKELNLQTSIIQKYNDKVDIGLLSIHPQYSDLENGNWGLTGLIQSLGKKTKPEKTLFQLSLNHRQDQASYSADFYRPTGLHPKHILSLKSVSLPSQSNNCTLFAKYTIPKSLFLDSYQLADLEQSTASSVSTGRLVGVWGETDLEAPIWAVDGWGSEALVEIYPPKEQDFMFALPMHSRYEVPQQKDNEILVHEQIPWPTVFWACNGDPESKPSLPEMPIISYESLFPSNTTYHFLQSNQVNISSPSKTEFTIPVAPFAHYDTIQITTVILIFGGFTWLLWKIWRNLSNQSTQHRKED